MFVNRLTLALRASALLLLSLVYMLGGVARAQAPMPSPENVQSLPSIRAAAEKAVRGVIDAGVTGVSLETTSLDPRLRLAACPSKLDTFANAPRGNQSRVVVRVSCAQPAWTLNLPVEIRRRQPVLVLKRA